MGTREKLFRQKLADQVEGLLTKSEKVFTSEKLDNDWLTAMISKTQELNSALTIYQFLHELPENEKLQVEFLELKEEEETAKTKVEIPNYGDEILKEIDDFEIEQSEEVFEIVEEISEPKETDTIIEQEEVEAEIITTEEPEEEPVEEPIIVAEVEATEEPFIDVIHETESTSEENVTEEEAQIEINDTVADSSPSLADKLSNKTIAKLADSIALNERFLFSNELFNGNMEAFKRALTELDHIASKEDANRYIDKQLKEEHNWNMESETVQGFIALVERRFN